MDGRLAAFVAVSTLLIVTPGPDMALVTRNALRHGRHAAAVTAYGVAVGIAAWGLASVLGLAVLLERSAVAFTVVKLAGAVYLFVLGVRALISPGPPSSAHPVAGAASGSIVDRAAFAQGLLGNLLNPKAGVIFVTVVPQFVRPGDGALRLLLMLAIFELVLLAWLNLYGYLVVRGLGGATRTRPRTVVQRVSGVVLIGLGVRLATERT